jgi:hypothetical protein
MGANSTQGLAVTAFLLGCTVIAMSAFWGLVPVLIGIALVVVSVVLFKKCKPWEDAGKEVQPNGSHGLVGNPAGLRDQHS